MQYSKQNMLHTTHVKCQTIRIQLNKTEITTLNKATKYHPQWIRILTVLSLLPKSVHR
jgi:hypothetical protein